VISKNPANRNTKKAAPKAALATIHNDRVIIGRKDRSSISWTFWCDAYM
jgi:hypothetical protein